MEVERPSEKKKKKKKKMKRCVWKVLRKKEGSLWNDFFFRLNEF